MSKTYILFTEEELDNLRDGIELKCTDARGVLYISCWKSIFIPPIAVLKRTGILAIE